MGVNRHLCVKAAQPGWAAQVMRLYSDMTGPLLCG